MGATRKDPEISALYFELASECFNKAATANDAGAADAFASNGPQLHRPGHGLKSVARQ